MSFSSRSCITFSKLIDGKYTISTSYIYHQLELYETCLSDVCQLCMLSNLIVRKCAQKAIIGILNNLQSTYRIVNRRCHEEKREKTTHLIIVQNLFSPSVLFANFLSVKCYSLRIQFFCQDGNNS